MQNDSHFPCPKGEFVILLVMTQACERIWGKLLLFSSGKILKDQKFLNTQPCCRTSNVVSDCFVLCGMVRPPPSLMIEACFTTRSMTYNCFSLKVRKIIYLKLPNLKGSLNLKFFLIHLSQRKGKYKQFVNCCSWSLSIFMLMF